MIHLTKHFLKSVVIPITLLWAQSPVFATEIAAWAALKQGGYIVLFRHANAPGGGDPMTVVIGDCATQRNLDEVGRVQSGKLGERFRSRRIQIEALWSSQWCRTRDTAALAFPAITRKDEPAFNSFFSNPNLAPEQTEKARQLLINWRGTGNLVVITHQVNMTQLTNVFPASGEGVVLKAANNTLTVVGRIAPN